MCLREEDLKVPQRRGLDGASEEKWRWPRPRQTHAKDATAIPDAAHSCWKVNLDELWLLLLIQTSRRAMKAMPIVSRRMTKASAGCCLCGHRYLRRARDATAIPDVAHSC